MRHTIYVFANPADRNRDIYKIGCTRQTVLQRRRQYLSYWPTGCEIKYAVKCHKGPTAEKLIHKSLKRFRYGEHAREFVKCDLKRVCQTIDEIVSSVSSRHDEEDVRQMQMDMDMEKEKIDSKKSDDLDLDSEDSDSTDNDSDDSDYRP